MSRIIWRGKEFERVLKKGVSKNMEAALVTLKAEIRQTISRTQPTVENPDGEIIGQNPSKPGEPPKRASSELYLSIDSVVEEEGMDVVGRTGSDASHSLELEFGSVRDVPLTGGGTVNREVAPRPYLRPTFDSNVDKIGRRIVRKIKGL